MCDTQYCLCDWTAVDAASCFFFFCSPCLNEEALGSPRRHSSPLPPAPPLAIISTPHLGPALVPSLAVIPSSLCSQRRWSGPGPAIPFPANLLPHLLPLPPHPDCLICTLYEAERLDGWYFPRLQCHLEHIINCPCDRGGGSQYGETLEVITMCSPGWLASWLAGMSHDHRLAVKVSSSSVLLMRSTVCLVREWSAKFKAKYFYFFILRERGISPGEAGHFD